MNTITVKRRKGTNETYIATCGALKVTSKFEEGTSVEANTIAAMKSLAKVLNWSFTDYSMGILSEDEYVFVPCSDETLRVIDPTK